MNTIKKFREKNHLTQEQLAEKLGVQRTTVTLWELGINTPRTPTLLKLAYVLKCSVTDLLCDESNKK